MNLVRCVGMVAGGQHGTEGGVRPKEATAVEEGSAFVQEIEVDPTGSGPLDGLTFAVKDLVDIGGYKTGCGNPNWRYTHPPATVNAVCVEQLLAAGARCVGKTVTDELAFSLLGENHFYGTLSTRKHPTGSLGGPLAGRHLQWPAVWPTSRSAPTPGDRSVSPLATAASGACGRRTGLSPWRA